MKKLPINNLEKAWVESSMVWLATHIGIEAFFKSDIILPNQPTGRPISFEKLKDVHFTFYEQLGGTKTPLSLSLQTGSSTHSTCRLREGVLFFPDRLLSNDQDAIATLAHHLSAAWLEGNCTTNWTPEELNWFSDLLPVYLGWGIFGANTTVFTRSDRIGEHENWRIDRHRVLTSRMFGYGLALFVWGHGEQHPDWHHLLRPDAKMPFRKMLQYLEATNDSFFQPTTARYRSYSDSRELFHQLDAPSPSILIATLWEIQNRGWFEPDLVGHLTALLNHRDPHVRLESLNSLALGTTLPDTTIEKAATLLTDSSEQVRASAATLIGNVQPAHSEDCYGIGHLLLDTCEIVVMASAGAIATFAPQDDYLARNLLKALRRALINCNYELAVSIGRAFYSTHRDADEKLEQFFEHDPDLKQQARVMMGPETGAD